jgi:hypothetical protein
MSKDAPSKNIFGQNENIEKNKKKPMDSPIDGFFKTKPTKRSNLEERTTLDTIHQFQVQKIMSEKNDLGDLQEEYDDLIIRIENEGDELRRGQYERRLDNIHGLIHEKSKDDKIDDYFLKTGSILFDYYEIQNAISKGDKDMYAKKVKARPGDVLNALENASKNNTIDDDSISFDWFGSASAQVSADVSVLVPAPALVLVPVQDDQESQGDAEPEPVQSITNTPIVSRDVLLEKYLQRINPAYTKKTSCALDDELGTCPECAKEMIFAVNEAMLYCPGCNYNEFILIDSDRPSYKDPPRESSYYAYKRINHFNELLAQFQAKENTGIDETTFGLIEAEIKKQRITDLTKLTNVRLREILKKLKLNRLYDHTNYILNRLNGTNAAIIDRDTEEKLRHMFKEIQPAFQKHIPKDRSNFLAYPYVLYKFCELLEMDHFLKNFQLLKNRDKLYDQDTIWKKICEEMRWQFIPTV